MVGIKSMADRIEFNAKLLNFYQVSDLQELVYAQDAHIEKLQNKLQAYITLFGPINTKVTTRKPEGLPNRVLNGVSEGVHIGFNTKYFRKP